MCVCEAACVCGLAVAGCVGVVCAPLSPCVVEHVCMRGLVLVCATRVLSCHVCVTGLAVLLCVPGCASVSVWRCVSV